LHAGEFSGDIWGKAHGEFGAAENRPGASARGPDAFFTRSRFRLNSSAPYVLALSERADGGGELEPLAIEAPF
jgi:hypothetical protein